MDISKVRKLIALVKEKVKLMDKQAATITRPKLKVTDFNISENASGYGTTMENVTMLDPLHIHSIINEIKGSDEFKEIAKEIAQNYPLPKKQQNTVLQTEFWLENFLYKIGTEELNGRFDENKEIEMIMNLRNELEEGPLVYTSEIYLDGIFLEDDKIILDDNIVIRKPTASDIERQLGNTFDSFSHMHEIPTAVAVVSKKSKDQKEMRQEQERLLSILRLFRLGSVYPDSSKNSNNSVLWTSGMGTAYFYKLVIHNKYTVRMSDSKDLVAFYQMIKNIIPLETQVNVDRKFSGVRIALSRYSNALLEAVEPERRLLTSVIGLEALFTQEGEKSETSYRSAIRLSKLLGLVGLNPIDVKNDIAKCYVIRNKVGHGILLEDKDRQDAAKYEDRLQNYLRQSIILFLMLLQEKSKGEIIDWIDRSMILSSVTTELEEWINKKILDLPKIVLR